MKTQKLQRKISLNKEAIASLDKKEMAQLQGGGIRTWVECPGTPQTPTTRISDLCIQPL